MLRTNCINTFGNKRCGAQIRTRVAHKLCRSCYKVRHGISRSLGRTTKEKVVIVKASKITTTPTKRKK